MHASDCPLHFWAFTLQNNQFVASEVLKAAGDDKNPQLAILAYTQAARWVKEHPEYKSRIGDIAQELAFVFGLPRRMQALLALQQSQPNSEQTQRMQAELRDGLQRFAAAAWRNLSTAVLQPGMQRPVKVQPESTPRASAIELPSLEHRQLAEKYGLTIEQVVTTHREALELNVSPEAAVEAYKAIQGGPYTLRQVLDVTKQARSQWLDSDGRHGLYFTDGTMSLARNDVIEAETELSAVTEDQINRYWDESKKQYPQVATQFEQIANILNPTGSNFAQKLFFYNSRLDGSYFSLSQAAFLARNRMLTPSAKLAPNLQAIEAELKAALINGTPQVAEMPLQLRDGRVVHFTVYLDENGQLQMAEKLRLESNAPHQGAYPLMRTATGDFMYTHTVKNFWEPLLPLHSALLPEQGITYQLFPATQADQAVRHADGYAALKHQLAQQMNIEAEEAQVWAVDSQGQPLRFRVHWGMVSDLQNADQSQQTQLLTDPPMSASQLNNLRNMRYVLAPISRPMRVEPRARSPIAFDMVQQLPTGENWTRQVQLGEAYVLHTGREKVLRAIEDAARRYFIESGMAQRGQELRVNVRVDLHLHFQLHLTTQPRPEGPGWTVAVEYLDADARRLTQDSKGNLRLASSQRADGVVLANQTSQQRVLLEIYDVKRNGQPPPALYRTGNDKPGVLTPNQRAVAKAIKQIEEGPYRASLDPLLPTGFMVAQAGLKYGLDSKSYDSDATLLNDTLEQTRRLYYGWVWQEKPSNSRLTRALTVTLGIRPVGGDKHEFFQIRVWASKNAQGNITARHAQVLDVKGNPLPVDYLKRPYLVCSDGQTVLLEEALSSQKVSFVFSPVGLLPGEVAAGSATPQQVAVQKLDFYGEASNVTIDSEELEIGRRWRLQNGRWLGSLPVEAHVGYIGARKGQALIANVAAKTTNGEIFHLLVKVKAAGILGSAPGEALDLYGKPLPKHRTFSELVVEYHLDPHSKP